MITKFKGILIDLSGLGWSWAGLMSAVPSGL